MVSNKSDKIPSAWQVPSANTCWSLRRALGEWYARCRRDLPWRRTNDPYRIWVSEVMLQQTQVQTVEPYYHRFLEQFPDVGSLAKADLQAVLKLWEGLGYYSRARNLHKAAAVVANDMGGRIPDTFEGLRCLPGIGAYIAAAIASIAFGLPHAVVDGNVKRVLARLFLMDVPVNSASGHKAFQAAADLLLDGHHPGDHNQAMMELGALVCTPRLPRCSDCPLDGFCLAFKTRRIDRYPRRDKRPPLPTRRMVAAVVLKNGRILLVRRPDQGLLGGLWEFPGGPSGKSDDPVQSCIEQLQSTVNLVISVDHRLATVTHAYTHFKLEMDVYLCHWQSGRVRLNGPAAFQWLAPARIGDLPLHGAVQKTLVHLRKRIGIEPNQPA